MKLARALFFFFSLVSVVGQAYAAGNSAWCVANPTNCIFSEPLNSNSYSDSGGFKDDTTTTTKQGATEGIAGKVFFRNGGSVGGKTAAQLPEAFAALPVGHSLTYVAADPATAQTGAWSFGCDLSSGNQARRECTGYVYYSTDFRFQQGDTCSNSNSGKIFQFTLTSGPIFEFASNLVIEAWNTGWTIGSLDCCLVGPGSDAGVSTEFAYSRVRGSWIKWSITWEDGDSGGSPTVMRIYGRNVTRGSAEYKIIDTSIPTNQPAGDQWTSTQATTLDRSSGGLSYGYLNLFRNLVGGSGDNCNGFNAVSHWEGAAWSTKEGQRIGAAVEVEGGAIASNYIRDAGIELDPSVIFNDKFEDSATAIGNRYNGDAPAGIGVSTDKPTASGGLQSVRLIPSGVAGTLYRQLPTNYDTLYMRYYVKYLSAVSHHSGAYMGGYSPAQSFPQGDAGLKGVTLDGTRKLFISGWEERNSPDSIVPHTRLDTYDQWVDMQSSCSNGSCFGVLLGITENAPIQVNTWQCVEMKIKMNTTAAGREGEKIMWVNDVPVLTLIPGSPVGTYSSAGNWTTGAGSAFPGFRWRDVLTYGINWIKIQNYNDVAPSPQDVLFDDLVVATSRIGCLNSGSADTTPPAVPTGVTVTSLVEQ